MADRTLPYAVWQLVVRTPADEDAVQRFLAVRSEEARRGFVAALLVIARRATPEQLDAGWPRLPTRVLTPDPEAELENASLDPPPTLVVAPVACLHCGGPLPPARADGGRPRVYHDGCQQQAAALRRSRRRREQREAATAGE
jgi:hypothetical protein